MSATQFTRARLVAWPNIALAATAALGLVCLMGVRGLNGFPLNADHAYFLPVSFYFNAAGRLDNPWLNPIDSHAFNWHGFVQPWLVAEMSLGGGWEGVTFGLDLLASLTFVFALIAARRLGLGVWETCAIGLISLALLLDMRSRPEVLTSVLSVALLLLVARRERGFFADVRIAAGAGLIFGMLLCAHPAIFGLVGLCFAAYALALWGVERPSWGRLAAFTLIAAAVFAVTALALAQFVYHGSIVDWLAGVARHAAKTANRQDTERFAGYFLSNRFLPGLALGFAFAAPLAARLIAAPSPGWPPALWRAALALAALCVAAAFYKVAVRVPATYYNFTGVLIALAMAACLTARGRPMLARVNHAALAALAAGSLVGALLWLGQNAYDGPMIHSSAAALEADVRAELAAGRKVCADAAALTAMRDVGDALKLHISVPVSNEELAPSRAQCDVYVRLQAQVYSPTPGEIPGFALAADHFIAHPATIGWMRPLYYGYAIYR